jgi:hypothetical protein
MNKFYAVTLFALLSFVRLQASGGDIFARRTDRFNSSRSSSHCWIVRGHRGDARCDCGKYGCALLNEYNTMRNNRILAYQQRMTECFPPMDLCHVCEL